MNNKQRNQINFRADERIREKLRTLADQAQRTQSNWLRWIIDREWKELTTPSDSDNQESEQQA